MDKHLELSDDKDAAGRIVALAEFIVERKDAILAGTYDIEIVNLGEGSLLELATFGVSAKQGVRFKINIDLQDISQAP